MRLTRSYWMVITYELIQKFPVLAIEPLGDYNGNCVSWDTCIHCLTDAGKQYREPYHSVVVLNIIESDLTHLRLMTHIQTSVNWITSGSGYGLLFTRRQSVAWNYTELS